MNQKGIYSHKNPKTGEFYYLHSKISKNGKTPLYYFSREIIDGVSMPTGYEVETNRYTGMPYLRKTRKEDK